MMPDEPFVHPRYAPGAVLGAGAQGVVFRVTDREDEARPLVAKLWRPGVFGAEALRGEFSLLARLRIPGLVRAHDLGREQATGAPFLVEDFIDGPDAHGWLAAVSGAERVRRLVRLLEEVLLTLGTLHEAGFLHGDLKPVHVRVPPAGRATLLDLGAAVPGARVGPAWGEGVRALSPGFAAPELLAGGNPSPSSDLYGLGALGWSIVAGGTPLAGPRRGALRDRAPWVPPSVADFVESLLAEHPGDRPQDAREALARLGASAGSTPARERRPEASGGGPVVGREGVIAALGAPFQAPVRYLVGAGGLGKSHLAREALTAALLAGRDARLLAFPIEDGRLLAGLLAFLRGVDEAFPFGHGGPEPLLVVLDDLHRAPPEVAAALDAYRCRARQPARAEILATAREAPDGADRVPLGPLAPAALSALCRQLGEASEAAIEEHARAADGNPGWLLASLGRVPLTGDAVAARISAVPPPARGIFAAAALLGGELAERWALALDSAARTHLAALLTAGLLWRRASPGGAIYALSSPQLAGEVLPAVVELARAEDLAEILLADPAAPARVLLALARVPTGGRASLLRAAAERARREGLTSVESEALLALCTEEAHRSPDALRRLERLTRDTGQAAAHPQVLGWLDRAADADPRLRPLSLRRRAEKLAREGNTEGAEQAAAGALAAAREQGDPVAEAFALATVGLVALFRAAWERAHDALREARRLLVLQPAPDDPEEIARLEHNLGVVASYRGQAAEAIGAFERSLAAKQRLGDRAGVRASLRNLGYALTQAGRFDEAARALDEALALARSLGQAAGRAWCLSARAEVEARRGAPREAERFIAEAEALGDALPAAVRVDLCLLRAEVLAMEGDGPTALTQLRSLDPAERSEDALADARALVIEARAHLACLPAAPRRAARAAIAAIRRARAGGLPEPEAQGIAALRQARSPRDAGLPARADQAHDAPMDSEHSAALWAWLERVGEGQPIEACAIDLALLILGQSGAERAFVALVSPAADILSAWAVDLDGLALGDAVRRVPMDALRASLTHPAPIYQRAVPTVGGQGARLAVASAEGPAGRVVLLIEHRLVPGRFDRLDEARVLRWRSLAAVLGRLAADARPAPLPAASRPASAPSAPTPAASAPPPAPSTPPRSEPEPPPRRRSPPPEVTTIQPEGELRRQFPAILGSSEPLRRALARLDLAIDSELPVLIVGETGVGKELFARAVHEQGARSQAPFVAVNCAAIPDSLFEAELFGHARGSFTGADRARPGLIARAEGGTLFLDEIGELKPARQASLLRVLESRLYRPVGSDEERPARVRVVAATNVELERAVEAGAFRQDLLFRLNVLRIRVPPLRERPEDVAFLAHHFLERAGAAPAFSPAALSALQAHGWPGNVRELEHQMQRLAVLRLPRIELAHLPREIRATAPVSAPAPRSAPDERDEVTRALDACGGNISHAAKQLGLTRHGLKKRMLRLGLRERAEAKSTP